MFPRTRLIPLALLVLLGACGEPPEPPLKSPPLISPSAAPISIDPSLPPVISQPLPTQVIPTGGVGYPTLPAYPTYPTYAYPTVTTTPPGDTVPATPTPSHAPKCTGSPTGTEILAAVKAQKTGLPNKSFRVDGGPYCADNWSFATFEVAGESEDQLEPLMVVATGKGSAIVVVAAGSEVCLSSVQTQAPPSIRVLACGF